MSTLTRKIQSGIQRGVKSRNCKHFISLEEKFHLELGSNLDRIDVSIEIKTNSNKITWEEWGSNPNDPIVVVLPSFSMSSHCASTEENSTPGWWEGMIGKGKYIDTSKYRVICASILGGPFGTTSSISINPKTGKPFGPDFPLITPSDQANVHQRLLRHLGVKKVHAVIGGSLGGMQALAFSALFPKLVDKTIAICCTAQSSPGTVALRHLQRLAITNDSEFREGRYEVGKGPKKGLALARELATITYRSTEEFDKKFKWSVQHPLKPQSDMFEIERYLRHKSSKFVYDANCYITLSHCMDLMDLSRGFKNLQEGLKRIRSNTLLVGFEKDILIPVREMSSMYNIMKENKNLVDLEVHPSIYGHDSFLLEYNWLGPLVKRFLES